MLGVFAPSLLFVVSRLVLGRRQTMPVARTLFGVLLVLLGAAGTTVFS
jgi:hypothetical protein